MQPTNDLDPGELAATLARIARTTVRSGGPQDLSLSALAVLGRLRREGPRRVTELATGEGLSQPAVTSLVNRLVPQGLLARSADPDDGRAVLVCLTDEGAALLDRRRAEQTRQLRAVLEELPAGDAEALRAALPALARFADVYESAVHAPPALAAGRPR
jgi:DNA-binding MarR family transcriptional regulator